MHTVTRVFQLNLGVLIAATIARLLRIPVPDLVFLVSIALMVLLGASYLIAILDAIAKGHR